MIATRKRLSVTLAQKTAICAAVAACFTPAAGMANPTGAQVAAGQATFNAQGPLLNVTNAPGTVINWQRFSIGSGETTRFIQQSAQSAVLNRVIAADPSVILGTLSSNGKVFLINPAGILVGAGGRVDVAAFVASTLNLTNEDFAAGRLRFQTTPNAGSVVNEGTITSPSGGQVYLIAPNVTNSGVITTPNGETILAAGTQLELFDTATPGVRVLIDVPGGEAKNLGQIVADSGRIGIVGALVQNRGRLSADQVVGDGTGRIFLKASNVATLSAGSTTTANGASGGNIAVSGETGAVIEKDALIQANGTETGGSITIASPAGSSVIAGSLQATGGNQGGTISVTSSASGLQIDGQLTAQATAGRGGSITLSTDGALTLNALSALDASGAAAGGTIAHNAASIAVAAGSAVTASGASGGAIAFQAGGGGATIDGSIEATGAAATGGRIDVASSANVTIGDAAKLQASGARGGTVHIEARSDSTSDTTTTLGGLIDVFGHDGEGGKVQLLGPRVAIVRNGVIEVSGMRGGGIALVGGDYQGKNPDVPNATATYVGPDTAIKADAVTAGDGGKIIVWSNDATQAYGTISARGGAQSGKGGFVETSGHYLDVDGIRVNTGAPSGPAGTWLLDPSDLELNNDSSDNNIRHDTAFKPSGSSAKLRWSTIQSGLDGGNVTVTTSGSSDTSGDTGAIKITAGASYTSNNALSIQAVDTISVEAAILNSGSGGITLKGNTVNIRANVSTGAGGVTINATNANFSGGTAKINGTYSVAGTTTISGGTANFDADANVPTLTLSSGTLGGSATVTTDNLNWTGGNLVGKLTLSSGKTGTLSSAAKFIGNSSGSEGTFTNKGTINDNTPNGLSALYIYKGSFNNQGTYSLTTDALIGDDSGLGVINNTGTFTKSGGTGTSTISAKFVNSVDGLASGRVNVNSGTLKLAPPSSSSATHTGAFSVASGATLQFGSGTHNVVGETSGGGDLAVKGGTLNVTGAYRLTGQMSFADGASTFATSSGSMKPSAVGVNGGSVRFNSDLDTPTFSFTGGTLSGTGVLTVSSALTRTGGTIDGTVGGLDVTQASGDLTPGAWAANGRVSLATKGGALQLDSISAATIVGKSHGGDVTLNRGTTLSASGSSDAVVLVSENKFVNNAGASAISTPNGRWLVYSKDPSLDVRGALAYDFKHYGSTYDGTSYSGPGTGNGFLYSTAPSVTPSLTGTVSKTYDGTTAASLFATNFATSGALDDDTISYSTTIAPTYADKNAGSGKNVSTTVAIAGAAHGAAKVYGYQLARGNINASIGKITPATVTLDGVIANNKVYDTTTAATLNMAEASLKGVFAGDAVTFASGTATFADKNVGTAKPVTAKGFALTGTDATNYIVTQPGGLVADITPAPLAILGLSAANKVYDGGTSVTLNGGTLSGVLSNEVVRVALSAAFADKNAGASKRVNASAALSGADASNYSLTVPALSADISPKPLSTWIASTGGLWSDAANWDHGIVPDAANVTAVSIPTAGTGIIYDLTAGNTTLRTLESSQSLVLRGGTLTLGSTTADVSTIRAGSSLQIQSGGALAANGTLNAASYSQTGGSLTGTGAFVVPNDFTQNGGTVALSGLGSATITQKTGNLVVGSFSAPTVTLVASGGAIGQNASIVATTLSADATNGISLTNSGNRIGALAARNAGVADIAVTNSGALNIASLTNNGGNVIIDNSGPITTVGLVSAPAGAVSITAHSPLTIGAGGVSAGGNIALTAGQTAAAGDDLRLSGAVTSTGTSGDIALNAGDELFQGANVTSSGGSIAATAQSGDINMSLGTNTSSGGGAIRYAASAGNLVLTGLDAGSGSIEVTAGRDALSASGHTGANLIARSAVINAGGNAQLATQLQQVTTDVGGGYALTDVATGNVLSNLVTVTAAPVAQAEQSVVTAVVSSTATTSTTSTTATSASGTSASSRTANSTASTTATTLVTSSGASATALPVKTDPNGTIGGGANEFGGSAVANPAPSSTQGAQKSASSTESSSKPEGDQRNESRDRPQDKRATQTAEKRSEAKSASKKAPVCR